MEGNRQSRNEWRNLVPIKATKTTYGQQFKSRGHEWYTVIIGAPFINPIYFVVDVGVTSPTGIKGNCLIGVLSPEF